MLRLALLFATLASMVWAQNSGTITGTITDKSAAAIGAAKVTVLNLDTQVSRDATTDDNGLFRFILLPPGRYKVSANKAVAKFRQNYRADSVSVSSRKTLDLVKVGNRWLIVRESTGN